MAVRTKRADEAPEAPPVTLIVRCPECGVGALLRDIVEDGCLSCGFQLDLELQRDDK